MFLIQILIFNVLFSGYKTYFILSRKSDRHPSFNGSTGINRSQLKFESLQLIISPPTVSPMSRPRLLSCNDQKHLKPMTNPNFLSPGAVKVKTNSLPNILDSEGEEMDISDDKDPTLSAKSPISTTGSERTFKMKMWKIPKFLKKHPEHAEVETIQINDESQGKTMNVLSSFLLNYSLYLYAQAR